MTSKILPCISLTPEDGGASISPLILNKKASNISDISPDEKKIITPFEITQTPINLEPKDHRELINAPSKYEKEIMKVDKERDRNNPNFNFIPNEKDKLKNQTSLNLPKFSTIESLTSGLSNQNINLIKNKVTQKSSGITTASDNRSKKSEGVIKGILIF